MTIGHHHISMITKSAQINNEFYTKVLGLRRVGMTVNQDSPNMYHLFYGDKIGAPGTELTFFEIPMVGRTQRGTNAITQIGLFVPSFQSLQYWEQRYRSLVSQQMASAALQDVQHYSLKIRRAYDLSS